MKKRFGSLMLSCALAGTGWVLSGCTPDAYKRSADLQVNQLVKDREKQTLGYAPEAEASTTASATPTRRTYESIPTTRVPEAQPPVIPPPISHVESEQLGPLELFGPGLVAPKHEPMSVEDAQRPLVDSLKLGPPSVASKSTTFDLLKSIEYAVQHSRDYQSRMEDLYLAAMDVTLQRHLFSPRPFARTGVRYNGGQLDVGYRSALTITNSVGVRQQLPYGGEIVAQGLFDFVNALGDTSSNGESAQAALSASVPLLRGAGMINLNPLIQSERNLIYEVRQFEEFRRSFVVNIASQYFRLITSQQAIVNRRYTYVSSVQTAEQSAALFIAGRQSNFVSVQRAQSSVYTSEQDIINAQDSYDSSVDDFKIAIGMPVEEALEIVPVTIDITPPDLDENVAALALRYRLDFQTASDQIEDARRSLEIAKNGLLPDLDFSASGSVANRDNTPGAQIDSRTMNYSAGLALDLPIDRLQERNSFRRSLISLERAQRNWAQTRDTIVAQVRDAVRAIRSAESQLAIAQRRIELERKRLDYSIELQVLGRSNDSRDAVDAQTALLNAQDSYDRARANYQIQVLSFLRDTGTLRLNPDAGVLGTVLDREGRRLQSYAADPNANQTD